MNHCCNSSWESGITQHLVKISVDFDADKLSLANVRHPNPLDRLLFSLILFWSCGFLSLSDYIRLMPFLSGSLESCLPYPSRGGKTYVLKQGFSVYSEPTRWLGFICKLWETCLQLQPVDADSIILRMIEKKNSLFGHFSRRENPLQSPSLFFKVKICPFDSAKIDYPIVNKFYEGYQKVSPKRSTKKDSHR